MHLFELASQETGQWGRSKKLRLIRARRKRQALATTLLVVLVDAVSTWLIYSRKVHALTDKDTVALADFDNKTGDAVFDDTLRQGLTMQLEQSPFLALISDDKINQTLKLMGRHSVSV